MNARSEERRQGRRLPKAWRNVLVLVSVLAAIALFYAEEDWRGKRAWGKYAKELAARGEAVAASQLVPPPVPDDENFAMTPFLAPLFDFEPGTQKWRDTNAFARLQNFPLEFNAASSEVKTPNSMRSNSWIGVPIDLRAWDVALQQGTNSRKSTETRVVSNNLTTAEAAAGVLASLERYDATIEELRTASRRSWSRFKLSYDYPDPAAVLLPHLALLKRTSQLLNVRAAAELGVGKTGPAVEDINLMFYLAESIRDEPILISHLVRIAESQIALQAVARGLASHQWSDAQLAGFEERLAKFNFCADGRRALAGERVVFGGGVIDYVRNAPNKFRVLESFGGMSDRQNSGVDPVPVIYALAPDGWLYFEKLNYNRAFQDFLVPALDASNRRVSPEASRKAAGKIEAIVKQRGPGLFLRHQFFVGFLMPALSKAIQRTAFAQAAVDEAAVACALERHRLAHGAYPDSLEALAPQLIAQVPHDVITGQALKYRRAADGQYVLYSVGWNEKDDGGVVAVNDSGKAMDAENGDWVWTLIPAAHAD
ncbi:MAG TPA: hypothetical protein VJA21_28015 [Verrucomicrobiae bacterium]